MRHTDRSNRLTQYRDAGRRIARNALLALVTMGIAGCSDIPLLPTWDTEWSIPLVNRTTDNLFGPYTVSIQPGASFEALLPIEAILLDEQLLAVLGQQMKSASLVFTISKVLDVGGSYTLAVAGDSAGLRAGNASGIALDFAMTSASRTTTDSAVVSVAGLAMLQSVADARGRLWVQLRGRTTYAGPGALIISPRDSISVRVTLRATIAASN